MSACRQVERVAARAHRLVRLRSLVATKVAVAVQDKANARSVRRAGRCAPLVHAHAQAAESADARLASGRAQASRFRPALVSCGQVRVQAIAFAAFRRGLVSSRAIIGGSCLTIVIQKRPRLKSMDSYLLQY